MSRNQIFFPASQISTRSVICSPICMANCPARSRGSVAFSAWTGARLSFVHGNFAATILLYQSLVENLLAAFLHAGLIMDDLPPRIAFRDTLKLCRDRNLISVQDSRGLDSLRNLLSHFQTVADGQNLDHRAIDAGFRSGVLIEQDAWFAIGLAVRILAKPQFRF